MAEQVTQRNKFDVAMELTRYHFKTIASVKSADDFEQTFAKYYALASYCETASPTDLQKLLSDELVAKVGELKELSISDVSF